jgi:hypothetical protein
MDTSICLQLQPCTKLIELGFLEADSSRKHLAFLDGRAAESSAEGLAPYAA